MLSVVMQSVIMFIVVALTLQPYLRVLYLWVCHHCHLQSSLMKVMESNSDICNFIPNYDYSDFFKMDYRRFYEHTFTATTNYKTCKQLLKVLLKLSSLR